MAEGKVGVRQASAPDRDIDNEFLANRDGDSVYRQRVAVAASLDRVISDYDVRTDGNPVYVGFNAQSALVANTTWVVYKLFYDSSNRLIDKQVIINIAWTARTTQSWRAAQGN